MHKASSRITKEMDLQKFLHRQRVFIASLLGLLKGRQSSFVHRYSKLVLRESTDMEITSEDEELDELGNGSLQFISSMISSSDKVDKRLINIFKLR